MTILLQTVTSLRVRSARRAIPAGMALCLCSQSLGSVYRRGRGLLLLAVFCLLPLPRPAAGADPPGGIDIQTFTDDVKGPLKAGGVLNAVLTGSRNGHAEFAIPGIVEKVTMRETSPGTYAGSYTVRPGVSVSGAALVGKLSYPGIAAPLVSATDALTLDAVPPRVVLVSPSRGETVGVARPLLYASLSDTGGVGVDAAATQIFLDGVDLTRLSQRAGDAVGVTPPGPLSPGTHQVRVVAADRLGNRSTTEWRFSVAADGPAPAFSCSAAADQVFSAGQTLRFTLQAPPGGRATVSIGAVVADVPVAEGRAGLYTGEYTVRPGDDGQSIPVVAHFRGAGGRSVTLPLPAGITLSAGPPPRPRITYPPIDDFLTGETLQMEGIAAPGANVRVSINYVSTALGGLFPIRGMAGVKEVTADGQGRWRIDDVSLAIPSLIVRDQDTVFTINAVTVAGNGDVSLPAKVTARRG